uniref:Secreted protein n=1 Tax=Steinernema glaseri TaxID=37863 RepID=A0A1I7YSC3_9BILA
MKPSPKTLPLDYPSSLPSPHFHFLYQNFKARSVYARSREKPEMHISSWLPIIFIISLLASELSAMPVASAELDKPDASTTVSHHKHRHRRNHTLHKKRRSLSLKEKDGNGRSKMMLTKPYWPWP